LFGKRKVRLEEQIASALIEVVLSLFHFQIRPEFKKQPREIKNTSKEMTKLCSQNNFHDFL